MSYTPKGLATVALLKTRLDAGHDHLALFEPLILDALLHLTTQDFIAQDIKAVLNERTGIFLPVSAVQTLLGRCTRRGLVTRQGGRFFRTATPLVDPLLDTTRAGLQADQARLGAAFMAYAAESSVEISTPDEAVAALATFVS